MLRARSPSWAVSSNIINNAARRKKNFESKKKKEEKGACLFVGPTSRRCGCGQVRSHRNNETRTKVAWNAKGGAVSTFLLGWGLLHRRSRSDSNPGFTTQAK